MRIASERLLLWSTLLVGALVLCPGCGTESGAGLDGEAVTSARKAVSSPWYRTRGTNTQDLFGDNIFLADLDGDEVSELVQYASNKLFVKRSDYEQTGLFHTYFTTTVQRLFTGDFFERGYDQVCTIRSSILYCYEMRSDGTGLDQLGVQGNPISNNEEIIVGDYDGDNRDDLLLYHKTTGGIRFFAVASGATTFTQKPDMVLGNLSSIAVPGTQLRAAEFTGDSRMDLLAVNTSGQILRFDSVSSNGQDTFWWAFSTDGGTVGADDQVTVAHLDNNKYDDIVVHNKTTGTNTFYQAQYQSDGTLKPLTTANQGQLGVIANSRLVWGRLHGNLIEPGAILRDDAIVFAPSTRFMYRYDARWDSAASAFTYWWAFSEAAPGNHTGWITATNKPWLILKCRFKNGVTTEPHTHAWLSDLFLNTGTEGLRDFWRDVSYGTWQTSGSTMPSTWYEVDVTFADAQSLSRNDVIQKCVDKYGLSTTAYFNVLTLYNENIGAGAPWVGGRVLMDPEHLTGVAVGHEMGHGFGWGHSFDDSGRVMVSQPPWFSQPGEYYDLWDIMSGLYELSFQSSITNTFFGPELVAPLRRQMSFIPSQRIKTLTPGSTPKTATIDIAALERPEANGYLMATIGSSTTNYVSIEFRQRTGYDRNIDADAVLVHRVINGAPYLLTGGGSSPTIQGTELTAGEIRTLNEGKVTVVSIDSSSGVATVKIDY
jgi:hypothetical protein